MSLTLALAAAGLAGNALGMSQSAKANRKYDNYLQGLRSELKSNFNNDYYTDYLDTDEAKSAIRVYLDQMKEANENIASSGAITGSTAEREVATKSENTKDFGTNLARMAGLGTQRKERIKSNYRSEKAGLDQMTLQNMAQKGQDWQNFSSNAMGLTTGAILSGMNPTSGAGGGFKLSDLIQKAKMFNSVNQGMKRLPF